MTQACTIASAALTARVAWLQAQSASGQQLTADECLVDIAQTACVAAVGASDAMRLVGDQGQANLAALLAAAQQQQQQLTAAQMAQQLRSGGGRLPRSAMLTSCLEGMGSMPAGEALQRMPLLVSTAAAVRPLNLLPAVPAPRCDPALDRVDSDPSVVAAAAAAARRGSSSSGSEDGAARPSRAAASARGAPLSPEGLPFRFAQLRMDSRAGQVRGGSRGWVAVREEPARPGPPLC